MDYNEDASTSQLRRRRGRRACLCTSLAVILSVALILGVTLGLTLGSTASSNFKETVMRRCRSFVKENSGATRPSEADCEKVWNEFTKAFVGKDPCDVPPVAYLDLIHALPQDPVCNKKLFWSKTKDVVHAFTEDRSCYVTLEDTLVGHMLDGLTWCSRNNSIDVLTEQCPGWNDCLHNPVRSFWIQASAEFAASACGDVSAMLNGSIGVPFDPNSIFASIEVKNFNPSIMKALNVILVVKETDTKTCENDESLKILRNQLDTGVKFACQTVQLSSVEKCIAQPQTPCGECW